MSNHGVAIFHAFGISRLAFSSHFEIPLAFLNEYLIFTTHEVAIDLIQPSSAFGFPAVCSWTRVSKSSVVENLELAWYKELQRPGATILVPFAL